MDTPPGGNTYCESSKTYRKGGCGSKVAGLYIHGKRARKYFATREEAETFVEAEEIKRENLEARATRIDGPLAEDAVRAADLLQPHGLTVFDAARLAAESVVKLTPYSVGVGEAVNFYVETMRQAARAPFGKADVAREVARAPQHFEPRPLRDFFSGIELQKIK